MQTHAHIILADGQVDAVEYSEEAAAAHMADLREMGCAPQRVIVPAAREGEAYDFIDEYCRRDTRPCKRSSSKLNEWKEMFS